MAKKKSTAALEGEEIAPTPTEEAIPQDGDNPPEEEIEAAAPEEEAAEEISEESLGLPDTTKIKLLMKGPIRGADGHKIAEGQTGPVATHLADALVGRGQAEYVG